METTEICLLPEKIQYLLIHQVKLGPPPSRIYVVAAEWLYGIQHTMT